MKRGDKRRTPSLLCGRESGLKAAAGRTHQHPESGAVVNGAGQHHGGVSQVSLQVAVGGAVGEQQLREVGEYEEKLNAATLRSSNHSCCVAAKKSCRLILRIS